MALILNIDTATEHASVCLSLDGKVLLEEVSLEQKNHASFLQPAIKKILQDACININQLDAVAVTHGPGSYTGLRVGLSSAKGICYAINKPLITLNTLEVMVESVVTNAQSIIPTNNLRPVLYCPLIDARRMEVFTAIYNQAKQAIIEPTAMILDEESFRTELSNNLIIFSGSGSFKLKNILKNKHAIFTDIAYSAVNMPLLTEKLFASKSFANIAYSEPFYGKEFYSPVRN